MRTLLLSSVGFTLAVILFCISCSGPPKHQASWDISVRNDTAMVFDEVKVQWGNHLACRSDASLSPSQFTTILWGDESPSRDTAELIITQHKGEQPHSITVAVTALKALPAGKHEVVFSISALDSARVDVDGPPCHYNLLVIEATRQKWELLHPGTPNDLPSWANLRADFPHDWTTGMPVCPAGGAYTIGRVGEDAKCSIGGEGHKL